MNEELIDAPNSKSLERISNYIEMFSFPRLPGTEGEKRAIDLTVKKFKEIGFENDQISKESFKFSNFYSTILIKLIIIFSFTIVLSLMLMVYISHLSLFLIIGVSSFLTLSTCSAIIPV